MTQPPTIVPHASASHEGPSIDYQQAMKLLALAEKLQDKVDAGERAARKAILIFLVVMIVVAWLIIGAVVFGPSVRVNSDGFKSPENNFIVWSLMSAPLVAALFAVSSLLTAANKLRDLHWDRQAVYRIVDELREFESIFQYGSVSVLERLEFSVRISRFGIGSGAYGRPAAPMISNVLRLAWGYHLH